MRPVVDMSSLGLLLLLPCSTLAGGSVSVSIKDLGALAGLESLNIQGATYFVPLLLFLKIRISLLGPDLITYI